MASSSPSDSTLVSFSQLQAPTMVISANLSPLTLCLDRSNYAFWRSQVLPVVRAHELKGFLLRTQLKHMCSFQIQPI